MEINEDGSMVGKTFSGDKYKGEYPHPKDGETYAEYSDRVDQLKEEGFHLGDLRWGDWRSYCIGFGNDPDISANDYIN